MRRDLILVAFGLCACPSPAPSPAVDGGSPVLDSGAAPAPDASENAGSDTGMVMPDGGGSLPDGGSATPRDTGPEVVDAGGRPELSDVFLENPMGTYEFLELWFEDPEEEPPPFTGIVFADNGAAAMMADLEPCTPLFVFAEWRLDGEGRLLTYDSPEVPEGDLIFGAVAANGDVTIRFPGGGAVMRPVRTDCHTMESHLGAWEMPGDEQAQPMSIVLTEDERYVVMQSTDPCFPLMSTGYDLAGPWLRVQEEIGGGPDGWGEPVGVFVKGGQMVLGGLEEGMAPFQRIDRCDDGEMSRPPEALAGTYRVIGEGAPSPFMALSENGELKLLSSASPCTVMALGQYTASNMVFGYHLGEERGLGAYRLEGAEITVYQGMDPRSPVRFTLERIRSACH